MSDGKQPASYRHYENTKHFEFVNVMFQGGQTFVSGEYVIPGMLDVISYWDRLTVNVHSQTPG